MHIAIDTTIRSTGKHRSRTIKACRHAIEAAGLITENQSLKAQLKDAKRLLKEKDKTIAGVKWEQIQLKRENTNLRKNELKLSGEIKKLTESLRIAKLPKTSANSSRPPSTGLYKPKRSPVNLREKD